MIFYGGYPELYAEQLSVNQTMQESIRGAYAEGMPILAECGGFLYLGKSLQDLQGNAWPMVGLTEGDGYRTDRLGRFGYIDLTENSAEQPAAGGSAQHEADTGRSACSRRTSSTIMIPPPTEQPFMRRNRQASETGTASSAERTSWQDSHIFTTTRIQNSRRSF